MSLESVNDSRSTWGAAAAAPSKAALFGRREEGANFADALEKNVGFGVQDQAGGAAVSPAGSAGALDDMMSQLRFAFLKNNVSGGVNQSVNSALA